MKIKVTISMMALVMVASAGSVYAQSSADAYRDQTVFSKMLEKLGRGALNIVTSVVEIPRQIAIEWDAAGEPVTGVVLGSVKGVGWAFARAVTGAYEVLTFPIPIPEDYEPMLDPPYVVTDVWGDSIPQLNDLHSNDPLYNGEDGVHPERFRF